MTAKLHRTLPAGGPALRRRRLAAAFASCLLIAAAPAVTAPEAELNSVHPELRSIARGIMQAQRNGVTYKPAKPGPLPSGVEERQVPGLRGHPAVQSMS